MFGGLAFMVNGRMCCGVLKTDLVLRLAPEEAAASLRQPHTRPMDLRQRDRHGFRSSPGNLGWICGEARPERPGNKECTSSSRGASDYFFRFGRSRISDFKVSVQESGTEAGLKHCIASHAW